MVPSSWAIDDAYQIVATGERVFYPYKSGVGTADVTVRADSAGLKNAEIDMRDVDQLIERLKAMCRLIVEARDIADLEHEFMLGAKLDDCLHIAEQRLSVLKSS